MGAAVAGSSCHPARSYTDLWDATDDRGIRGPTRRKWSCSPIGGAEGRSNDRGVTSHHAHEQSAVRASDPAGAKNGSPKRRAAGALMTRAGLEELQVELSGLRRHADEEIAQQLREARSYGDSSNNDEYHAVREQQMVVEARIASLDEAIANAIVVHAEEGADSVAVIGSTVVIEDLASGQKTRHRLASAHSSERTAVSAASPIGRALIGARPGTAVTVDLPNGRSRSLRLLAVELREVEG